MTEGEKLLFRAVLQHVETRLAEARENPKIGAITALEDIRDFIQRMSSVL